MTSIYELKKLWKDANNPEIFRIRELSRFMKEDFLISLRVLFDTREYHYPHAIIGKLKDLGYQSHFSQLLSSDLQVFVGDYDPDYFPVPGFVFMIEVSPSTTDSYNEIRGFPDMHRARADEDDFKKFLTRKPSDVDLASWFVENHSEDFYNGYKSLCYYQEKIYMPILVSEKELSDTNPDIATVLRREDS